MTDVRESILTRLVTVCRVAGISTVIRNRLMPTDDQLPLISICEGDEIADESDPEPRPANAPRRVRMTPDIVIMLGAVPETIGPSINAVRAALYKAIITDSQLLAMTINNRTIRYIGAGTELAYGRTMEGTMAMKFEFTYLLRPADL